MKLLTQAIIKKLEAHPIMSTDGQQEKEVLVKFFTPDSNWTWYVTEAEKMDNGDWEFFGLIDGMEKEWGSFWLSQLEEARGPLRMSIERDRNYKGTVSV